MNLKFGRRPLRAALIIAHFVLITAGALGWRPTSGSVMRWYGDLTGIFESYSFYAPDIGSDMNPEWTVYFPDGRVREVTLAADTLNFELRIRLKKRLARLRHLALTDEEKRPIVELVTRPLFQKFPSSQLVEARVFHERYSRRDLWYFGRFARPVR
jgi:hypothetical protein